MALAVQRAGGMGHAAMIRIDRSLLYGLLIGLLAGIVIHHFFASGASTGSSHAAAATAAADQLRRPVKLTAASLAGSVSALVPTAQQQQESQQQEPQQQYPPQQQQQQQQQQQEPPQEPQQQQEPAQQQQHPPDTSGSGTGTSSSGERQWLPEPDGYELPAECIKHEVLYAAVYDYLRPWFQRGITREDLDACKAVAPTGYNLSLGTPNKDPLNPRFRLLVWGNEVLVTSGGLERTGDQQQALHYFMIRQIQEAAQRFGLPNMEFAIAFGDLPADRESHLDQTDVGKKGALCPLLTFSKHPGLHHILVPSGEFMKYDYDGWVERMTRDDGGVPWEEREEKAIGRWSLFWTNLPHVDRWGQEEYDSREAYVNYSISTKHKYTLFKDPAQEGNRMPLSEQRRYKYTMNTDGFTASTRLAKLLATGQTVIKQDSRLIEFYYPALKPFVHYIPTGWNGLGEVDWTVSFLRRNDALARAVAANAQRFAATHLVAEGRYCYLKVLFEEMHKLMQYQPDLKDFPTTISYLDDVARFQVEPEKLMVEPEA